MLINVKLGEKIIKILCERGDYFSLQITYHPASEFHKGLWHLYGLSDPKTIQCDEEDDVLDLTLEGFPPIRKVVEIIEEENRYFPASLLVHKNHYDIIFQKRSKEERIYHFTFLPQYGLKVYFCND